MRSQGRCCTNEDSHNKENLRRYLQAPEIRKAVSDRCGLAQLKWRSSQIAAMPLAMVVGRLFVTTAMMVATAPALHSFGPPENSETATRDTIRHPGKARNPRAHVPSLGIFCPIRTPESRIINVPTVRARMTDQVSVTANRACHSGSSDAAEHQRP